MSRCFPFPPPGYEKKTRTDDVDLLTKEKHKEKKHKKDKKDKKRDSKEKKDKERSKDKHRDKKERKEKRKEKKKDKNREKDKAKVSDENKNDGQLQSYNGGKLNENMQNAVGIKDSKFVEEFGRRIGDEGSGTRNHMVENFAGCDHRKAEGTGRVVEKDIDSRAHGKENKDRKRDDEKTDNKRNRDEERGMGNAMVQNLTGLDQRRIGGMAKQVEKDVEKKRVEGKEKNKELGRDNKQGNGHKEKGREKKSKGEGKSKKGKTTEKVESDKKHDIIKEGGRDLKTTLNAKPLHATMESDKNSVTEGNLKKRKEYEANGFLHGNDVRPNKLPRPAFSHPFMENGRKLEPCQTPIQQQASSLHGEANNLLTEKKEHKVNGLIVDAQPSAIRSLSSSATTKKSSENGVTVTKPPHPDSKYLNQILLVPKMGEWSEFDDQEWLFSSDSHEPKKHKLVSSWVDETPQVWDKALQIESDDVCALPYVIPY